MLQREEGVRTKENKHEMSWLIVRNRSQNFCIFLDFENREIFVRILDETKGMQTNRDDAAIPKETGIVIC